MAPEKKRNTSFDTCSNTESTLAIGLSPVGPVDESCGRSLGLKQPRRRQSFSAEVHPWRLVNMSLYT